MKKPRRMPGPEYVFASFRAVRYKTSQRQQPNALVSLILPRPTNNMQASHTLMGSKSACHNGQALSF